MQLIKGIRDRAKTHRLHRRAAEDPYPRTYIELAKSLVSQGQTRKAMEAAREGLERFPHCDDLRDVLRYTWRQQMSAEIDRLRSSCDAGADAEAFRSLVMIYLDGDDFDEALAIAEEYSRRQPTSPEGCLLQGEVLLGRFYKDFVASDAMRAIVHLRRSIENDGESARPHELLAGLYQDVGAVSKALYHAYQARDRGDNEEVAKLCEDLEQLPLETEDESSLLRGIEENESVGVQAVRPDRKAVLLDLDRVSLLNGVTRAAFVAEGLTIVSSRGEGCVLEDGATDPLCDIARNFRDSAGVSSKRMGIGAFQSAVLTAGKHLLQFHGVGRTVMLVESDSPPYADVIKAECACFVASYLRRSPENDDE